MSVKQRPTQTAAFWQTEFQVAEKSIEALYNLFLEAGEPRSLDDICLFFVKQALEAEEQAIRNELEQGEVYRPDQAYEIGDKLVFPHFDYASGTVKAVDSGFNPVDGDFTILEIAFNNATQTTARFAANLKTPHRLSKTETRTAEGEEAPSMAQKLYGQYRYFIRTKIKKALEKHSEFIEFNRAWFLKDLLVDVQEGLLNIVDAAIDINAAPLNVDTLIEHIELQKNGSITEATRFSVNYRLTHESRFLNVGTPDHARWYLNRLKPPEVIEPPHNLLVSGDLSFNANALPQEITTLLSEIDDEATPIEFSKETEPDATEVTFVLNYPHRRSGTLPILPAIEELLPEGKNQLLALELIDGQSGDSIMGWCVTEHKYIYGVGDWFKKYNLPVGAFITLKTTEHPMKMVLDFVPQRTQREWTRVVTVKNNQLAFQMKNRALSCRYDELMILGEEDSEQIDGLWKRFNQQQTSIEDLLTRMFPELMKLTAQSAVHTNTLYSAINVARRCPPGPLLQALVQNDKFVWMGHGYWTYKPTAK